MLEADKRGRICSKEKALELIKSDKSAVDLAVLQIKGKIDEAQPLVFDGSMESLEILQETEIDPKALNMRYLPTSSTDVEGDRKVRLFGYSKPLVGKIRLAEENATASVQDAGWVEVNATGVAASGSSGCLLDASWLHERACP